MAATVVPNLAASWNSVSPAGWCEESRAYRRNGTWSRADRNAYYLADLQIVGINSRVGRLNGFNCSSRSAELV